MCIEIFSHSVLSALHDSWESHSTCSCFTSKIKSKLVNKRKIHGLMSLKFPGAHLALSSQFESRHRWCQDTPLSKLLHTRFPSRGSEGKCFPRSLCINLTGLSHCGQSNAMLSGQCGVNMSPQGNIRNSHQKNGWRDAGWQNQLGTPMKCKKDDEYAQSNCLQTWLSIRITWYAF